ncbi:DNA polymerase/3'-5' exonuclease PolX [Mucilaginibacter sp. BJC16-A38]|uniref:DNA polymerase/3'-5' exonuclease PolX n=1 Tax=Mucilaginibacter phenanthrenivorans TaxID=1234842 RepID=UPI002158228A|nr:DNA polymerase/3'-5' exonuclease PolX [Mucilaginibacter phenanthrenivorans]MCR8559843.1 DNA polymerase/3'-5' exonuclease PolX [Mucilaginibacter phenanthrenivorans]
MENKPIARKLRLLSQLMELHEENPFKIKSIANAAFKVDKLPFPVAGKSFAELEKVDGIGKSTAGKIIELLEKGTMTELDDMLAKTPEGIVEMMGIKGIGPKKVATIWKELGIENIGELFYACNENRLVEAKGFGLKTQEDIRKVIEFNMASHGKFLYAKVEQEAKDLLEQLKGVFPDALIEFAGEFRRYCEIINKLVIVLGSRDQEIAFNTLQHSELLQEIKTEGNHITGHIEHGLKVELICVEKRYFYSALFEFTGDDEHVQAVLSRTADLIDQPTSEDLIYTKAGLEYVFPELREGDTFIEKAAKKTLPHLINHADLKGTLHNHSTWSDGINTVEEMALYCRDELKLEYLGMCDHSKSAFYAKGLSTERVLQQQEEIDHLNKKLNGFHIFKGIESDILYDGSLDYPDEILAKFDFIVASVHSILKMDEEKATSRLIKAIENPYTTILGHPTGRLLLSRKGYPIDYKKVIDACAANNVVIEINANPLRLDLDWRWHQYALEKGVWLSINPDAHRKEGFLDMYYGLLVARKGGLYKERCLNALSLQEIGGFFGRKNSVIKG